MGLPRDPFKTIIAALSRTQVSVISVDVPSGMLCSILGQRFFNFMKCFFHFLSFLFLFFSFLLNHYILNLD